MAKKSQQKVSNWICPKCIKQHLVLLNEAGLPYIKDKDEEGDRWGCQNKDCNFTMPYYENEAHFMTYKRLELYALIFYKKSMEFVTQLSSTVEKLDKGRCNYG